MSGFDAVILAGGRAERLGGASKPELVIGGRRLLDTAIAAARAAGASRVVVVGPPELEATGCVVVREDPPFGGPVAALAAGLAALDALPSVGRVAPEGPSVGRVAPAGPSVGRVAPAGPSVGRVAPAGRVPRPPPDLLVLASDLPHAERAVARLLGARTADPDRDGVCLVDASGRSQWLTAVYSRAALGRALDALTGEDGDPGRLHGTAMRRLAASLDLGLTDDDGTARDIDTWHDLAEARRQTGGTTMAESQHPEVLDEWVAEAAPLLGLDAAEVPIGTLLELARRAAHGVARPAAPVTTYMLGLAVGSGRSDADLETLAERLGALAEQRGSGGAAM